MTTSTIYPEKLHNYVRAHGVLSDRPSSGSQDNYAEQLCRLGLEHPASNGELDTVLMAIRPFPTEAVESTGEELYGFTHRLGVVLSAKQKLREGDEDDFPAYDPKAQWTLAARKWAIRGDDDGGDLASAEEPVGPLARMFSLGGRASQQAERDELVLGVERARLAAKLIVANFHEYNSRICAALESKRYTAKFKDEEPGYRFAPGAIIDFPSFEVLEDGRRLASARLCVTVCLHESRSKIWTRFSALEDIRIDNECLQISDFLHRTRTWFDLLKTEVIDLYRSHIELALKKTGEKNPIISFLEKTGVELISADTDLPGLPELMSAVAQLGEFYSEKRRREVAYQLEAMISCIPGLGISPKHGHILRAIARKDPQVLESGGSYYLVPHRTTQGSLGVYVVRVFGSRIIFAGLAGTDPDPLVYTERMATPSRPAPRVPGIASQNVTGDIANTVASYF